MPLHLKNGFDKLLKHGCLIHLKYKFKLATITLIEQLLGESQPLKLYRNTKRQIPKNVKKSVDNCFVCIGVSFF